MPDPISQLFKDGDFAFSLGLRRGSDDFFKNGPDPTALLPERQKWLLEDPASYAIELPEATPLLSELLEYLEKLHGQPFFPQLHQLGASWEPDFLLLGRDLLHEHRLLAGCVCFPSHWVLAHKIGLPLSSIHGPVPTVNATLGRNIDAFLRHVQPGMVWERANWGLAATPQLNNHPALHLPRLGPDAELAGTWLRIERQAFRLLPRTRGILFGIRLEIIPLSEVAQDATLAKGLANALRTMPPEIAEYKGLATARLPLATLLS